MTFSIIARDEAAGRFGAAVASRAFAAGACTIFTQTATGAVVTQALVNPHYGPRGLALLAAGATASDVVRLLTAADEGYEYRQVHVMDRDGAFAGHTGTECHEWCGHICSGTFSVAGNILAGPEVLEAMASAFEEDAALPLPRRLISALRAGEAAGGDTRGRQSAALLVHDKEEYPLLDLRVDDHPDPIAELSRLEDVSRKQWLHFRRALPSIDNPTGITDAEEIHARIAASIAEGYE